MGVPVASGAVAIDRGYPLVLPIVFPDDDLGWVARADCDLRRGCPPAGGESPGGVVLAASSAGGSPRLVYAASLTDADGATGPGWTLTLAEADTLALAPGEYWADLSLTGAGAADDWLAGRLLFVVNRTGRGD